VLLGEWYYAVFPEPFGPAISRSLGFSGELSADNGSGIRLGMGHFLTKTGYQRLFDRLGLGADRLTDLFRKSREGLFRSILFQVPSPVRNEEVGGMAP
jgi:hypothetical protein